MKKILPLLMLFMLMLEVNLCFAQSTPGTAENFTANSTANSTIGGANPNHWYKLVTTGDGNLTLSATASQANGNTYMYIYLYDSDAATQLGTAGQYASNGGPAFTVNGLAKGTYYCLINSPDGFSNTYSITNSLALSPTNNDAEFNDYFNQPLTINENGSATGHIGYRYNGGTFDETDIYKLVVTTDANISISYTGDFANPSGSGGGSGYAYIYLFDKDSTAQLGTSGGYVSNGGASFTANGLAAGTYYVKINWGGSGGYFTGYTLTNQITSATAANDAELNDYFNQSLIINANDSVSGHIGYRRNGGSYDESDFYKLITGVDGNITISYTGDYSNPSGSGGGNGYAYLYLYDKDTTTQLGTAGGYVSNGGASFTVNGLAAGTYYAKIGWGGSGGYFTGYKLKCRLDSAAYVNDPEPNNTVATASLLNLNPNKSGHIGYRFNGGIYDTDDYWKIVMNSSDSMRVVLDFNGNGNNNAYVSVYLYNGAGSQLFLQSAYVVNQSSYNIYFPTLAAGDYYLRIVWGGSSAYYCSYNIPVLHVPCDNSAAVITAGGPTTFCEGGSVTLNTTPTFTAYGQSNGYTGYLWSNTATTQNITVNSSGSYSVEATDVDGCVHASNVIPVTVNPLPATPTISTGGGATTFCQGGSVTLTSSAATGNTWSTGATTQSITVTTSGNYTVTATANGCTSASSATTAVTVNPLPATPTISTGGGATTFCTGGSVTLTSSPATSYLWSNGATTQSINVTASGTFTVVVKNADGCSSVASAATTVTVNPLPTVSLSAFTAVCSTDAAFTLTGGSPAAGTYSGTGVSAGQFNPATAGAGTFTITYSYTNANNCTATAQQSITVNNCTAPCNASITPAGPTTFCTGGSVVLNASAGVSWAWSNGATTQSITVSIGGIYSVAVTDANNCTATAPGVTVTVNPLPVTPTISAGTSTTFCEGGTVTLTSSAATGNVWNTGATTQSINVNASGNYSVTVTNGNGCAASSTATTVTVNPLPIVSLAAFTAVCSTDAAFALSGGSPSGGTYSGTGVSAGQFDPATAGVGTFTITYSYTNANNCTATAQQSITINNCTAPCTATITAGSATTFCAGGSVTLTASAGTSWLWSNGATTQSITVTDAGSYSAAVTDANNCTATSNVIAVTVNPLPTVTLAAFTAKCSTDAAFTLTGGSPAGGTYSGTGVSAGEFDPATAGVGTYVIIYSYTNANGCTSTAQQSITVNNCTAPCTATIAAGSTTTFCAGGSVTLTASAGTSWLWSNGATTQSITVTAAGSYAATVTDANNCTATSNAIAVTVNPLPTVTLAAFTAKCSTDAAFTLTGGSPAGGTYSGTGVSGGQFNPVTAGVGTFSITYAYTNANGCTNTANQSITVNNCAGCTATITADKSTTFCKGGSVKLTASVGSSYSWNTGATTQSIIVASAGTYTVSVTNANNCTATASITVVVNDLPAVPVISASGPTTFCQGGSVTLTSTVAASYLWSTGATTQSITVTSSGNYSVIVKNESGCSRTSVAKNVVVTNCGSVYCAANGNSKAKGYIANVYLKSIYNNSGWSAGGYGNYLSQSATLNKRGSYIISVSPGFSSYFNISGLYTRVWVDWNQDGDFNDANEVVFSPGGASYFLRLGIVHVPANALSGRTRMRVAMSATGHPSSCGSFAYGEVEDYSIVVVGSSTGRNTEVEATEPVIANESFKLYPNPVSEQLVIQRSTNDPSKVVDARATMTMLDANGRIVLRSNLIRSTEMVDVRKYPSGIYFIQLKTNTGITTQKIIISH